MQLGRALGAAELRPVMHRQTQVDDGRVQADQLVPEAESLFASSLGRHNAVQIVEDLIEQLPGAVSVGIGQGRTGGGFDAKVRQLALATLQTALDFAQAVRLSQLTEQHADELAPARQAFATVFRLRLLDQALKVSARNELEYLAEHAA